MRCIMMLCSKSSNVTVLQDVCDAVEEGDTDKFQDVVAQYDSLTRLDAWKTTLLLRVKKRIPEGEEVSLA